MTRETGGWIGADLSPGARTVIVAAALALLTLLVYAEVWSHGFISLDDDEYVTENPAVLGGLTWPGVKWAFTTFHAANWHPLTWLSHMADVEWFGMWAGGHHGMNALLHAGCTVVLFLALRRMTGSVWRSGLAAALFGVHPLHVESVAWVAERKDVLSGLFFFLGLWGYARYAERPGAVRYLWVALFFVLGLLSKPMVVTFPFVLLLLDYWPLGRFRPGSAGPLVLEKAPLFLLSAGSCAVTYLAQRAGGAVGTVEVLPLGSRLSNAAMSYGAYLWKAAWPSGLVVFYPHPGEGGGSVPLWGIIGSAALLAVSTAAAVRWRDRGYPVAGWLWYLGMLVPVIGVVQVGAQAMADRYTYLPLTGIFVAVSWVLGECAAYGETRRRAVGAACAAAILGLSAGSWAQAGLWRDGVTLFGHALRETRGNWLMHANMGNTLQRLGRTQEAIVQYREAVRIAPDYSAGHDTLGIALASQGRYPEAIAEYRKAIRLSPRSLAARVNLGVALAEQGRYEEAITECVEALRIEPNHPVVHDNLGNYLVAMGLVEEGIGHFREALRLQPDYARARQNLTRALAMPRYGGGNDRRPRRTGR